MIEHIIWIVIDIILAISFFWRGGTGDIIMGVASCVCVVCWIIDWIFWYKKKRKKRL